MDSLFPKFIRQIKKKQQQKQTEKKQTNTTPHPPPPQKKDKKQNKKKTKKKPKQQSQYLFVNTTICSDNLIKTFPDRIYAYITMTVVKSYCLKRTWCNWHWPIISKLRLVTRQTEQIVQTETKHTI